MVQLKTTGKDAGIGYSFHEKSFTWFLSPTDALSPVTISVPHDGIRKSDLKGLFPTRKEGWTGTDGYVWPLVKGIAWNHPINTIRGLLPRFMLDYNRYASKKSFLSYAGILFEDTEEACEDKQLNKYHRVYHQKLVSTVIETKKLYGPKALFFDFHGFSKQPTYGNFDLILGTANTHTLTADKDKQFADFFEGKGYKVFLPSFRKIPIDPTTADWYDAGFTTRNVFLKTGVDSIQIEVSSEIRRNNELAKKFSSVMGEFLRTVI